MLPRPAILRALQRRDFEPLPNGKDVETACHLGIPLLVTNTKLRIHEVSPSTGVEVLPSTGVEVLPGVV